MQVCRAPTGGMWGPAHVTPQLSCFLSASFTASFSLGLASCALSQFTARENRLGKDWEWGREGGRERVMQGSRSSLEQSEGAVFLHRLQRYQVSLFCSQRLQSSSGAAILFEKGIWRKKQAQKLSGLPRVTGRGQESS